MKNLKVALVTTNQGIKYITSSILACGDTIMLDYYRNAHDVEIVSAKRGCEIVNINYNEFIKRELSDAKRYLKTMINLYGDASHVDEYGNGLEVMAAKEKIELIQKNI